MSEQNKKTISLTEMYWQIQKWLDEADMSTVDHIVEVAAGGYSHYKTEIFDKATLQPRISVTIHVNKELICLMEKSPIVAMEKTRIYIQSLKIQKENSDAVQDAIFEPQETITTA
jgi:hypothetical protein